MAAGSFKLRGKAHLLALEPRMMFDAAAATVVQNEVLGDADHGDHAAAFPATHDAAPSARTTDAAMGYRDTRTADPAAPSAADRSATPATNASAAPHDVIFIDTAVDDYQKLAAEWAGRGDVILIDSTKDGIDQMRAALAGESNVSAIHIVSHGSEGILYLGTTRIDEATIEGDLSASLGAIGRSLNPGGDILLYGCDFAEGADGARALAAFAQATHADVAASTDLTGYAGKGGDWVLESHIGDIEARTLSSDDWTHTLDPIVPVPIAVTPDSLTVTDASGRVVATGSTGYTTTNGTDRSSDVGAGATARWSGAATLADGTKVDLVATIVSITNGDFVRFNRPTSGTNGDDPTFLLRDASNGDAKNGDGANVQIQWSLVVSGTDTPIAANVEFGILDIDGVGGQPNTRESVSVASDNLSYYTAERQTDIAISPSLQQVVASGTQNENTVAGKALDTKSEVTFDWTKVSSFTINYALAANNGVTTQAQFYQDGNADFKYSDPVSVSIPRLDLDANDSTAPGNDAHFTFTTGGPDSAIVDSDVRVTNPMDVNSITGATLTLTNAQAGDALHVGTLPSNITATVTNGNGTIAVTLSGTGSEADYDTALRAVTFANTAAAPDTTQRVIDVNFTNTKLTSATAVSRITINNAPVANPDSQTTPEDTAATIAVLQNDTDADGDVLVVTAASAPHGTVAINSDGTLTYTPSADYNGQDTITYTISDGRGGTSTSTVAMTITPVNDPPRDVGTLPPQSAQDAQTVSYSTAGGFTDVDGDTLTYSATGLPTGLTIDRNTGVISGTLDRSASQTSGGAYAIAVTATDPSNTSATQNFTLTVTNPPPVAQDDSATTHANTATTINVLANDSDPDGDPLSVTSASAQHGTVTINPDNTVTYTPTDAYVGSDSIAYMISDGQGGTSSAHVAVSVTDAAPTNTALPAQTASDADTVSLNVAPNFSDADGDTLTYSASGLPAGLTIDRNTGVISGTMDRSASQANGGVYNSTITADDGHGRTDAAPLQWTIANPAPTARDDSATTPEEQATTIAVLANDSDPDGDPLTVTSASAQHGSVTINPDNTLTYTPDALYRGTDSIAYAISDGQGGTSSAHVAVTVTPVNHAPQDAGTLPAQSSQDAQTVSYATAGGFNDPDGDTLTYSATGLPSGLTIDRNSGVISGTLDRSASQASGGAYAIAVTATDPSNASATQRFTLTVTNPPPVAQDDTATTPEEQATTIAVLANDSDPDGDPLTVTSASAQHGSVMINPDNTLTYTPDALYRGNDSIAYAISDGQGGTSNAHVAVTVTPVNHPPHANAIPANYNAVDGAAVHASVAPAFTDPDGDPLTYAATGLPMGLAIDPATGIISGTIDRSASQMNGGRYTVTLTATDPSNTSATQTVTVTVTNPPPVAADDTATVHVDTPATIAVLANDSDPDGDPLMVTMATPQHGTVAINPDGTLAYTPPAGFAGTDTIAYTISDGQGGTSSATVTVTVADAAPTHSAIDPQAANDAQPVSLNAAQHFSDADGDTLTYAATGLPPGLTIDPITGVISGTIDRSASQANGGVYDSTITANDGHGGTDTAPIHWTVANPAPVAQDDTATTPEEQATTIAVLANDTDADGDPLTVTSASAQHGSATINPDNTLTYTPDALYRGNDSIAYTISDGQGGTATAHVAVTVTPVDHAPTAQPIAAQAGADAQPVALDVGGFFGDVDGDALTYSATGLPPGLAIDPATGRIAGTLDQAASRGSVYHVVVTATDPSQAKASSAFDWMIVNPAPVAADDAAVVAEDGHVVIPVLANDRDPDGDPLTVTTASAQHGTVAINPDGTITYTPGLYYRGNDVIVYSIADGDGGTASASVLVTVTPVDHAPAVVAAPPPAIDALEGNPVAIAAAPWFGDVDGDALAYSVSGLPKGLSIDPVSGAISGTIDRSAAGQALAADGRYTVTVTATDPSGLATSATFAIRVANPAPVVTDGSARTSEDTGLILPALANARDPDGDPMTVTAATAEHGTVTINPDGTLAYVPGALFSGTDTVRYTVTDGDGGTATAVVTVSVDHVNHAPVVPVQGQPVDAVGGRPTTIDALAGVTDVDGDRPTIVQATSANGSVFVSPDGIIRFTPDLGFAGTTTITYVVADGQGGFTSATLVVRVADGRGADIEELLRIGRVTFVDPSPGFARVTVTDGVIRNPLTILDTVEQVRSLNTTRIGRQPVGDAVEAIRTLGGTAIDPDHPILAEVARLDTLRDQRDAGDRLFDHRWGDFLVKGMSGFSAAADRNACIMVESVVRGGAIYLEVRDTAPEGVSPIRSVDVRPAHGPRPDWIRVDHRGLAIVEAAADMEELHLIVRVTRANGHVSATPIVVQGATGEIELDRAVPVHPHHHRAAPLDATLSTRHAAAHRHAAHIDRIFQ